jgi:ATP-dependent Clp protease ATP-binding subunit ClpA
VGRACEIARAAGHSVVGAEHFFLGMLHDRTMPVCVLSELADLDVVESAVLGLMREPGYCPPQGHLTPVVEPSVQPWGWRTADAMDDSYVGAEHLFLGIIRDRNTVPARALADLVDLAALDAAVLEVKNEPPRVPESGVFLPEGQEFDAPLEAAIRDLLPAGASYGVNTRDGRLWIMVIGPGDTREVLNSALSLLGRPPLD